MTRENTTRQMELVRRRAQKIVNDIERLQEASKRRNIEPSQNLVYQMILALHRIDGRPEEPDVVEVLEQMNPEEV